MIALHLFLAHTVADYSFTNPMKLYGLNDTTLKLKHWAWVSIVFLAFTFDITLSSPLGVLFLAMAVGMHFLTDVMRWKKVNSWIVESVSLGVFLVYAAILSSFFSDSFISPYFSMYLIGMVVVSVIPTQIFRMLGAIDAMDNESDGISERLAVFIFAVAQQYLFMFIAIAAALVYRVFFRKKPNWVWAVSPLIGMVLAFLFSWMLFSL